MWDLPGGGREDNETPIECVQRELIEEFGIYLDPESVVWTKEYPSTDIPGGRAHFFVARISKKDVDSISFGEEGQRWQFMEPEEFIAHENAVPRLQERLKDYLATAA